VNGPPVFSAGRRRSVRARLALCARSSTHHGIGILPTVPVQPTIAGIAAGRDEVLEKGIEVASR
jgi:hypothetical protein